MRLNWNGTSELFDSMMNDGSKPNQELDWHLTLEFVSEISISRSNSRLVGIYLRVYTQQDEKTRIRRHLKNAFGSMGGGSSKPKPFTIIVNVYDLANNQTNNLISSVLGKIEAILDITQHLLHVSILHQHCFDICCNKPDYNRHGMIIKHGTI